MCCYSKLCKDGSNSVPVAMVNYAMMEVTGYLLLVNSARMEVTVYVLLVNSARMEVTVYVLL